MAVFETILKSDLKKPVQVKQLSGNLFSGDNQGNKITVEVMDNGSPATLSGGVTGYVIREDNATVTISSGTLSGNKASVILPEEAYNVVGRVSIVVKVGTTTVGACTAYVYRTSTDTLVDPTGAIPSIQELLAKISACEQATADANKIANLTVSAQTATGSTPDAVLSETGSPAHKHITFKLVKGDKGDTGNTGATPQLSIGTVTTLQPSQDATVTITGTDEAPVLNFGIPQGASGNETIDDTAGLGDTDLVYSADKVRKELDTKAPVVDVPITTPASVQSFPDGADGLPMALKVAVEPVQDLHGYDNPWPGGGNKNLFDASGAVGTHSTLTFSLTSDGKLKISGTTNDSIYRAVTTPNLTPGTSYIVNGFLTGIRLRIREYDSGGSKIAETIFNTKTTFTVNANTVTMDFYIIVYSLSSTVIIEPMIRLSSIADDTFVPYSNICPISGWTGANVTRTGKNIFDGVIEQGGFDINGLNFGNNTRLRSKKFIRVKAGNKIFVSAETSASKSLKLSLSYYKNASYTEKRTDYENWVSPVGYVFTVPDNVNYARITIAFMDDSDITPDQISNAIVAYSESETLYEPYLDTVYPITFPQSAGTVYGGTLTVNKDGTGTLVVDWAEYTFTGNETLTTITENGKRFVTNTLANMGLYAADYSDVIHTQISSHYKPYSENVANYGFFRVVSVFVFNDFDNVIADSTEMKTYLQQQYSAGTPVQVSYKLATPVTYSLTPGQVKTLLGVNNLFADCGSITEVLYPADTKLYVDQQIADKISASQRMMELIVTANHEDEMKATKAYSTDDLLIVNGTLYKATTSIANGATLTVNTNVTATTVAAELAALV